MDVNKKAQQMQRKLDYICTKFQNYTPSGFLEKFFQVWEK
jgi:hypothetical protein